MCHKLWWNKWLCISHFEKLSVTYNEQHGTCFWISKDGCRLTGHLIHIVCNKWTRFNIDFSRLFFCCFRRCLLLLFCVCVKVQISFNYVEKKCDVVINYRTIKIKCDNKCDTDINWMVIFIFIYNLPLYVMQPHKGP